MKKLHFQTTATLVMSAFVLVACGGGGTSSQVTGAAAVTPAATVSVTGTAATGVAIAGGAVTLNCVSGKTGIASTGADGSFSVSAAGVTFPCVARVDYKDSAGASQQLHSFVTAAGNANINPVTDLLVANLTGGGALDAFDRFDAAKATGFTPALVAAAAGKVKAYLKTLGVDTTNLPDDPITTKLVAKNGTTPGDAFDKVLDDVKTKLTTAGLTIAGAAGKLNAPVAVVTPPTPVVPAQPGQLVASGTLTGLPPGITFTAATVVVNPLFAPKLSATDTSPPRQDASFTIQNTDKSFVIIVSGDVTAAGVGGPNALGLNLQSGKVDSGLEWNTSPLCFDSTYPKNCKIQAGVVIDRTGKKITFTNAVLDLPFGKAAEAFGKLTLNGTVTWQ